MANSMNGRSEAGAQAQLYYDGECAFCAACVRFVERRDRHGRIEAVPLQQSSYESSDGCYGSMLFVRGAHQSQYSSAAIDVLKTLGGGWAVLARLIWIIPKPLRDWAYRLIGTHRHWFGGQ